MRRYDFLALDFLTRGYTVSDLGFLQTRSFAAVLFRRIATKNTKDPRTGETKECFSNLSPEQRVAIREKLVGCLSSEQLPDVRNKIGDAIAEIARQYTDNGTLDVRLGVYTTADEMIGDSWPELLGVLFQASQSSEAGLREAAFRIFTTTPSIIEKQHQEAVLSVFSRGFKDDHVSVRRPLPVWSARH